MDTMLFKESLEETLANFKDLYTRVQQLEAAPLITSGSGGGAPVDAQYLVTSLNATLTQDRLIDVNNGLTYTDFGANNNFQIDLGTPSNVTSTSTNSVTASSHTHALDTLIGWPGTYGNATNVAQVTVDAKGRLTAISNVTISGVTPATHSMLGIYHSDTTTDAVTRGSIIYGNSTPEWDELGYPGSLHHLQTSGQDIIWDEDITMFASSWIGIGSSNPRVEFETSYIEILGGYTGIGKTTPASILHVYENTAAVGTSTGITIEQDGGGDAQLQFYLTGGQRWVLGIDNSDSDKFKIGRGAGWTTATTITIDTSGNTVFDGDITADMLTVSAADAIDFARSGYNVIGMYQSEPAVGKKGVHFYNETTTTYLLNILQTGEIGINTTSPVAMCHVDQSSTTGAMPVTALDQADLSEEFINFISTIGTGYPINTTALGSYYGRVRVAVNGTFKWLALYN